MISSKAYTIIALPIHLCILLGIRRDLITLDEKGEYQWKNREIYDRTYVGENLQTRANHYSVSLGKIIQDQFSQSSDLLSTAFSSFASALRIYINLTIELICMSLDQNTFYFIIIYARILFLIIQI